MLPQQAVKGKKEISDVFIRLKKKKKNPDFLFWLQTFLKPPGKATWQK